MHKIGVSLIEIFQSYANILSKLTRLEVKIMSRTIRRFVALGIGWALLMAVAGCCVPVYEEP